ncbi:hypothetical protein SAMN04488065_2330 [Haloplanus vescus]|uniref:Uncharacterized protein n=1 Tax=Haloplanus vescus TaxID=555874 RepID=A0A1H3ZG48_9EURY|nr:hypothetical protein [Haloplanus vescus]SEA22292.1 hypothetical protein SAMN04488065_2330 [Haloplanus vescus]
MPTFEYPCPECRTTNSLHDADCRFEGTPWADIEAAYVDVVAVLSGGVTDADALPEAVTEWGPLRQAAVERLRRDGRIDDTNDRLRLLPAEEYREAVSVPTRDPIKTIYERGSVPGCHDNAVFAMIAWYEMVGLSWAETKQNVTEWLRESGTWDRGGFEEASPEALVEKKRHVYEAGYGWKEKATAAKRVIDRSL